MLKRVLALSALFQKYVWGYAQEGTPPRRCGGDPPPCEGEGASPVPTPHAFVKRTTKVPPSCSTMLTKMDQLFKHRRHRWCRSPGNKPRPICQAPAQAQHRRLQSRTSHPGVLSCPGFAPTWPSRRARRRWHTARSSRDDTLPRRDFHRPCLQLSCTNQRRIPPTMTADDGGGTPR